MISAGEQMTRTGNPQGRPARYTPKNRNRAMNISLTDEGRQHLDEQAQAQGLSRPDYIEGLVRGDVTAKPINS